MRHSEDFTAQNYLKGAFDRGALNHGMHLKSFRVQLGSYLSFNAATPGSSSPARNSSVAPPPVEICVMRSATPAFVTAATESPPPTITVAPRSAASATALAMPIVP